MIKIELAIVEKNLTCRQYSIFLLRKVIVLWHFLAKQQKKVTTNRVHPFVQCTLIQRRHRHHFSHVVI